MILRMFCFYCVWVQRFAFSPIEKTNKKENTYERMMATFCFIKNIDIRFYWFPKQKPCLCFFTVHNFPFVCVIQIIKPFLCVCMFVSKMSQVITFCPTLCVEIEKNKLNL